MYIGDGLRPKSGHATNWYVEFYNIFVFVVVFCWYITPNQAIVTGVLILFFMFYSVYIKPIKREEFVLDERFFGDLFWFNEFIDGILFYSLYKGFTIKKKILFCIMSH